MSSWYQPDTPPLPPGKGATFKQILGMLAFGTTGSLFVVKAVKSQPGHSLGVGSVMIFFALVFFTGLISKRRWVEMVTSGILLLGAGGLAALAINRTSILWAVGAVFFLMCITAIQLKHKFVDRTPDGTLRNPYT